MQLVELNLRAYGPFTNKILPFKTQGGPQLHIVFGPNEAGKSSALRALRNVLFGMDARDAHLHPADMLRVGLRLRTGDGQILDVERRKGKGLKSLVFAASGKPVPVEEWARALPVASAELFEQMFGLDYDRLVLGGRQLASFKGDIGEAILAASGDLGQTVAQMNGFVDRADEIYAPQATARLLNKALREFRDAETRIRKERFTSNEYKGAITRANDLEEELNQITGELIRCVKERNRLTLLQTATPHVQLLTQAQAELDGLQDAVLPVDFEKRYSKLTGERDVAAGRQHEAKAEMIRLKNHLAAIPRKPDLAALVSGIDRLKEQAGQIEKARLDLPKRETEYRGHSVQRQKLCADWKLTPEALPQITAEQRRRIDSLAKRYLSLETRRAELPKRIANQQALVRQMELALAELPADCKTDALTQILKQIPAKKQTGAETQRLRQERDQMKATLERDISTVPLWNGTAEQLESARVPLPISLSDMQTRFAKQQTRQEQALSERRNLGRERERFERKLVQLEREGTIPTEAELVQARAQRDLGWRAVKESWLDGLENGPAGIEFLGSEEKTLPEAFEASIVAADSLSDSLRFEADRVENKRTALEELEGCERRIADQEDLIVALQQESAGLDKEWQDLWQEAAIQPRSPREMVEWIELRKTLIETLRDLRRLDAQLTDAEAEEKLWRESLAQALQTSPEQPLAHLAAAAEAKISEADAIRNRRNEFVAGKRQAQTNLETEVEEQRSNDATLDAWKGQWMQAIIHLPIDATVEPATVQELISRIAEVKSITEAMESLQHRIEAMRNDEAEYTRQVQALARRAARPELAEGDALIAVGRLQDLARAARDNELEAERVTAEQVRREQELAEAIADVERCTADLNELLKAGGISELALVPEAVERSKRKLDLTKQLQEQLQALGRSAGGAPLDTFMQEVQDASPEAREVQLRDIEEKINGLENEKAEKTREQERIHSGFRLKEDAKDVSEAACRKYSAAARIDGLLSEYLRNQISATLLSKAMALYRDKNQDPLLKRASEYFASLTCQTFSGIAVEQRDNDRVLQAIRSSSKESLDIPGLSDGTRDQLFLALRLAYIENHCTTNESCPVILDDVLMAFDDRRARAALSVLRDLSQKTQVLVFTHHAHHVKLAEEVLGSTGFQLHELAPLTAAAGGSGVAFR